MNDFDRRIHAGYLLSHFRDRFALRVWTPTDQIARLCGDDLYITQWTTDGDEAGVSIAVSTSVTTSRPEFSAFGPIKVRLLARIANNAGDPLVEWKFQTGENHGISAAYTGWQNLTEINVTVTPPATGDGDYGIFDSLTASGA